MKIKKFQCPYCKANLTKEGIIVNEIGSTTTWIKYNSEGEQTEEDQIDGQTDEYTAYCGKCNKALELELGEVWDTLPEIIGKYVCF